MANSHARLMDDRQVASNQGNSSHSTSASEHMKDSDEPTVGKGGIGGGLMATRL